MQSTSAGCIETLRRLRTLPPDESLEGTVLIALQDCICARYGIDERADTDFEHLAIMSIKAHDPASKGLSSQALAKRIRQYDCHQTTLVAKMKTLFTMYVERELGVSTDDDEVARAKTLEAYASLIARALRTERGGSA